MSCSGEEVPAVAGSEQRVGRVLKFFARAAILGGAVIMPAAVLAHGGGGQTQLEQAAAEQGLTGIQPGGMRIVGTDCPPSNPIGFSATGDNPQGVQVEATGCFDMFGVEQPSIGSQELPTT